MSFDEKIAALSQKLPGIIGQMGTEEATKNALVMPFIAALGYDVFNPAEVVPEFTADVGTKKGEKVDYAIMNDGQPVFLIECKKAGEDLSDDNMSQLYRYFGATQVRIAILTNGVKYRFFSDLDDKNKMDKRPFLELDLSDPKTHALAEVKKMAKAEFDLDRLLSTANRLKYVSAIKKEIERQYKEPDEDFVKMFFKHVMGGRAFTAAWKEEFTSMTKRAFQLFISEQVNVRFRSALEQEKEENTPETEQAPVENKKGIMTTEEELEGFRIVCAIMAQVVDPERIFQRDTKSYFGILLDDSNRKPICRLHFNAVSQKYLGVFDENKKETKIPIKALSDIYKYSEKIRGIMKLYEG